MAPLEYRVIKLPDQWPGTPTPSYQRGRPPFKAMWAQTLKDLRREVAMLGGRDVTIALDVSDFDLRNDGQLRANARPKSPAVILGFKNNKGDRFEFPCDRFGFWQDNLDAIARAMQDLRRIDRYGVKAGKQYEGFKALPERATETLTAQAAAKFISKVSGYGDAVILSLASSARDAIRVAQSRSHPDRGGNIDDFTLIGRCKIALELHFGAPL